ncbi:hypothetical protein ERJ75_001415200 [Trypanosoma vivax]|uniref:Transmembrane protein n=1 Tax=Trypanosoma vivax (strain Y486) TaxID=1055687 RepID=G0TUE6_TRYVY|nr:hypothetical protein TRVL_04116 [Trypanosoma vivax]KAH8607443.1 hypothetical protein ERJ75_001415200 [Trypanosoma vivax]CCC47580.1 conserved hypothetical protein [Trypanosoma vivax Y486]
MPLWPFRIGNDERFQVSSQQETIYDAIKGEMPPYRYGTEIDNYLQWRWRRGLIQSVFPVTCYGAIAGFLIGVRQARIEGRYIGRCRVLWRYSSTLAAVGLLTTAFHHVLVVRNNYRDRLHYPIVAGASGASVLMWAAQMGTLGQGMLAGSLIGVLYALGCYAVKYYHTRRLNVFLRQQQTQQVPVHKVSPELQRMYRAYLYDNRPLEDVDVFKRHTDVLSMEEGDLRLDAKRIIYNMAPEVYDWVNFPDWWPLKFPQQTEEERMLYERQRDEEVERRKRAIMESDDGMMIKRMNRMKKYRDA